MVSLVVRTLPYSELSDGYLREGHVLPGFFTSLAVAVLVLADTPPVSETGKTTVKHAQSPVDTEGSRPVVILFQNYFSSVSQIMRRVMHS